MSLPRFDGQGSLFGAANLAGELFESTDRYRLFREKVLPLLIRTRPQMEKMYCLDNGRPGIEPVRLAGVSLLQYMERLPDREATKNIKYHLGWKYALDVELTDKGFDPTCLVEFRKRLLANKQVSLVFDKILEGLQEDRLVRRRSKQRLDSTHVLGDVSRMSRLELVRETIRLALTAVEERGPAKPPSWDVWLERYCRTKVDWRSNAVQLREKMKQAGEDAAAILTWVEGKEMPAGLAEVAVLKRVFEEQFETGAEKTIAQRPVESSGTIKNPHDVDAQWSAKDAEKKTAWVGYKAQVMETVAEDGKVCEQGTPTEQFITEITTTEAIAGDIDGMERTLKAHEDRGQESPSELFVDTAYVTDDTLAQAKETGTELTGPARESPQHLGGFSSDKFDVNTERREAICPAGKTSSQCSFIRDAHQGREYYRFEWAKQCDDCPLQRDCTRSVGGRRMLTVGKHHGLLQARRREMQTEEFKKRMKQRNGIEGTISELCRGYGMRRSRYRGLLKTRLANYLIGAACNVARWFRLIVWRASVAVAGG